MKKENMLAKQLRITEKQEKNFLQRKDNIFIETKINPLLSKIHSKIPAALVNKIDSAFYKGFQLVFEKGSSYIEKTYNRKKMNITHDLNNYAVDRYQSKKHMRSMINQNTQTKLLNESISALEGGVLGLLGVGLPDIPLFTAVIIKTIQETALTYGYDYDSTNEKEYILYLICAAMSPKDKSLEYDKEVDSLSEKLEADVDPQLSLDELMKKTASLLSESLLTLKFVQGLPIVGVIGGIVNPIILHRIGTYAGIKYKKRYLLSKIKNSTD